MPEVDRRELAAIFIGGAAGALLRAGLTKGFGEPAPAWPWVTFGANVLGAFLLGYFVTRLQERLPLSTYRRPLLGTGFCGALTTFSTMQVELIQLARHGRAPLAVAYFAASLAAGLLVMHLVSALTRRARIR